MKKKLLGLVLATSLVATALVGCGGSDASSDAANDANVEADANVDAEADTDAEADAEAEADASADAAAEPAGKVVMLYPGEETARFGEFLKNEFATKVKEDIGLELEMIFLPWDQYWTQKEVMLAANERVDLYWDGLADLANFVNKSMAQPLDELIAKNCPDMLKVFPESQLKGGTVNGEIYGIPSAYAPSSAMFQLVCVREDLAQAVGVTDIKTAEDLKAYAVAVKEAYPEMKGPADIIFKPLTRYFQDEQLTWVSGNEIAVLGEESKTVYSYYETEAFQEVAKFNQSMYDEGLYIDDLTTLYNERDSRMQTGLHIWVEGSIGKDQEIQSTVQQNAPDARLKTYLLAPEKDKYITSAGGEVLCVPYSAENPDGAMKFLNWLYKSQENYLFALYGVEGVDYNMVDGRIERITTEDFFYEWMFRNANYQVFGTDVSQEYIDEYQAWDDGAKTSAAMGFVFNNENVVELETAITEVVQSDMASIRCGFVNFEENYPAAVQKLKEAGIDEYIAEVQRQLDEYMAAN